MAKTVCSIIFLLVFLSSQASARMTEKQLAAAVKLVRNMCSGKTKATPEDIDKMHQGNWDVDHNAQCYMWCALNMYKLMDKDNHFDRKAAEAQLNQLPETMQEYVVKCMDQCEHAAEPKKGAWETGLNATTLDDKCVAAWEYSKCMYFCEPEKYFLP